MLYVALPGDLGKPRPAVIVQSDSYCKGETVLLCPLTSFLQDAPLFRLMVQPTGSNGLQRPSQIMIDKVSPHPRSKCGPVFGRLEETDMDELTRRLVALIGAT